MALTEASIDRILEGTSSLVAAIRSRADEVTSPDEIGRFISDVVAAHWAGTPEAVDGPRLPSVFTRIVIDRQLAFGRSQKPNAFDAPGERWVDLEIPFTDGERAAVEARLHRILQFTIAVNVERVALVRRFTPPPFPTWKEVVARATVIRPEDPEAREWVRSNPGDAPLAANAFDAAEARALIDSLYAAGAVRVVIATESIHDEEPPYADAIRVQLPADSAARAAVLALTNAQAESEGFNPVRDTGQDVVFLWWD